MRIAWLLLSCFLPLLVSGPPIRRRLHDYDLAEILSLFDETEPQPVREHRCKCNRVRNLRYHRRPRSHKYMDSDFDDYDEPDVRDYEPRYPTPRHYRNAEDYDPYIRDSDSVLREYNHDPQDYYPDSKEYEPDVRDYDGDWPENDRVLRKYEPDVRDYDGYSPDSERVMRKYEPDVRDYDGYWPDKERVMRKYEPDVRDYDPDLHDYNRHKGLRFVDGYEDEEDPGNVVLTFVEKPVDDSVLRRLRSRHHHRSRRRRRLRRVKYGPIVVKRTIIREPRKRRKHRKARKARRQLKESIGETYPVYSPRLSFDEDEEIEEMPEEELDVERLKRLRRRRKRRRVTQKSNDKEWCIGAECSKEIAPRKVRKSKERISDIACIGDGCPSPKKRKISRFEERSERKPGKILMKKSRKPNKKANKGKVCIGDDCDGTDLKSKKREPEIISSSRKSRRRNRRRKRRKRRKNQRKKKKKESDEITLGEPSNFWDK